MGFMMYGSAHVVDGELCKLKQNVADKDQQLMALRISNGMVTMKKAITMIELNGH